MSNKVNNLNGIRYIEETLCFEVKYVNYFYQSYKDNIFPFIETRLIRLNDIANSIELQDKIYCYYWGIPRGHMVGSSLLYTTTNQDNLFLENSSLERVKEYTEYRAKNRIEVKNKFYDDDYFEVVKDHFLAFKILDWHTKKDSLELDRFVICDYFETHKYKQLNSDNINKLFDKIFELKTNEDLFKLCKIVNEINNNV